MSKQRTQLPCQSNQFWWNDILFLLVILGTLYFILLGTRPLFVPDEGRYAEIAREMALSGNYLTPYLDGIKYFEKPVLFYWMAAGAIKLGGLNLWSLRSINALLALFSCLLTYFTARKLFDRATGLLAAFILGTSGLYFLMAHMISLDLPVTVFLTVSLYAFLLGNQQPVGISRRLYFWGASIAAGLAILTKGLIGIVFPIIIIGIWVVLLNKWRLLKHFYLPSCLIIVLLIAAPWHILAGLHNPEFFYFYFVEQHFLRYTTLEVGHYQPIWFFIPCIILGFFPWSVFLFQALTYHLSSWKNRHQHAVEIFLLLWALLIFAFFSFSQSKLIPYILPVFPPLAILTAHYLSGAIRQHFKLGMRVGFIFLLILAGCFAYAFYAFTQNVPLPNPELGKRYLGCAAAILLGGSLLSGIYFGRNNLKVVVILITSTWLFLILTLASGQAVDSRPVLPLTAILKPILQPQDDVITYNQYFQDLPFYLERRVSILNWKNELEFGMKHQDTHEWMINNKTFWERWHTKRVFVIISNDEFENIRKTNPQEKFYLLGKTINNALITNKL